MDYTSEEKWRCTSGLKILTSDADAGGRTRSRSPQVKRDRDGASVDDEGYRHQGRPNRQKRPAASGASQVVVEDVGDLHPSLQYFIANTPGKADENAD